MIANGLRIRERAARKYDRCSLKANTCHAGTLSNQCPARRKAGTNRSRTAIQESTFFFDGPTRPGKCEIGSGTTLAIIKPHIVTNKQAGAVLAEIAAHFHVQCMELFNVSKRAAAEFFEVYRGVVATSEYTGMVDELSSGPCLVLEIAHPCAAVPALRDAALFVPARACDGPSPAPCLLGPWGQSKL